MHARQAILKAADHLERNPKMWRYYATDVPAGCRTPACAVGWIAYFAGAPHGESFVSAVERLLGIHHGEFWERMTNGYTTLGNKKLSDLTGLEVAAMLRAYADKYHLAEKSKHVGIPASVRAIFNAAPVGELLSLNSETSR